MKNILTRALALWFPLLVILTGMLAFAYWAVQQNYRQSLNDPQIQMAEDAAATLDAGAAPASIVTRGVPLVDISTSLAPWVAVFDASGTPLESSASLGNLPLALPAGVFDVSTWKRVYAEYGIAMTIPKSETRFTWQPQIDVRQAVVLVRASNGTFVAAGRSMREAENRVSVLTMGAAILALMSALGSLVVIIALLVLGWL